MDESKRKSERPDYRSQPDSDYKTEKGLLFKKICVKCQWNYVACWKDTYGNCNYMGCRGCGSLWCDECFQKATRYRCQTCKERIKACCCCKYSGKCHKCSVKE